jgi:hypothetical protein
MTIPPPFWRRFWIVLVISALPASWCGAEQVPVRYLEGVTHGFLVVRDQAQKSVATGDIEQIVKGTVVTSKLRFRFKDGSLYEETTMFSQHGAFKVLSDHLLEKGPAFKNPMEVWIDRGASQVKVRELKDGKDKITSHRMSLPDDLANGIVSIVVKNFADDESHTVEILAATPKPRIVKLAISPEGADTFSVESTRYRAKRYVAKVNIGGIAGAVASLAGKRPPDTHIWILRAAAQGDTPAFLKSVGPLSSENSVWQIELASPSWPEAGKQTDNK